MRILLINQNYHPFIGGVETQMRLVAHGLSAEHHVDVAAVMFAQSRVPQRLAVLEANLLAPRYSSYSDGKVAVSSLTPTPLDRVKMLPIAMRAMPKLQRYAFHPLHRFGYPWYRSAFLPKLRKLAARADVIHCFAFGYLGWASLEAARSAGVPFVCTPFVHPHQWGDGPDDVKFYKRCDALIALVETDREYLISLGIPPEKIHVIGVSPELPDSVDPAAFRQRHGLGQSPVVLYIGRMMSQKGASAVLAAAPLVWNKHPEARFVFIGPANPQEASQFAGRDPRIQYLGKVSLQEKADALSACDIFCMPSMSEILPTVYLEAWSYGKPVVGGLAHGLRELVEGNGGGLVAAQEPAELSGVLSKLLDDPQLRGQFGARGKQLVAEQYSVPAVTRSLLELYQSVQKGSVCASL